MSGTSLIQRILADRGDEHLSEDLGKFFVAHDTKTALTLCEFILYGQDPTEGAQAVKNAAPSGGVCGMVWAAGQIAFKCSDCETDPTCAICSDCFYAGDHSTHNYRMIRTGGGCCDCGDASSWKPTGFCSNHRGLSEELDGEQAIALLPRYIQAAAPLVVRAVLSILDQTISNFEREILPSEDPSGTELIIELCQWLHKIALVAHGLRSVIAMELTRQFAEPLSEPTTVDQVVTYPNRMSYLENMMIGQYWLTTEARDSFHMLIFAMLVSPQFKRLFTVSYVNHYTRFVDQLMIPHNTEDDNDSDSSMLSLSVQLFTIPQLVMEQVRDRRLMDILVNTLTDLFLWSAHDNRTDKRPKTVNVGHRVISQRVYWRVMIDLRYVLHYKQVSSFLLTERPQSVRKLLELFALMQGMNRQERALVTHVEFESTVWLNSFNLELEAYKAISPLLETLKAPDCPSTVYNNFVNQCIDVMIESTQYAQSGSSLHFPLHRVLTTVLAKQLITDSPVVSLQNSFQCGPDFLNRIVSDVIRVRAFVAEVNAGLWVRNGESMKSQVLLYEASSCSEQMADLDLILLQIGLLLCPPKTFVQQMLSSFRLQPLFATFESGQPSFAELFLSARTRPDMRVAEQFMHLLIQMTNEEGPMLVAGLMDSRKDEDSASSDRMAEEEKALMNCLSRELVHRLAQADLTHSQIEKGIGKRFRKHSHFDDTLETVSDRIVTGNDQNIFRLRRFSWLQFDPFFIHLSRTELHTADERIQDLIKREGPERCADLIWNLNLGPQSRIRISSESDSDQSRTESTADATTIAMFQLRSRLADEAYAMLLLFVFHNTLVAGSHSSESLFYSSLKLLELAVSAYEPRVLNAFETKPFSSSDMDEHNIEKRQKLDSSSSGRGTLLSIRLNQEFKETRHKSLLSILGEMLQKKELDRLHKPLIRVISYIYETDVPSRPFLERYMSLMEEQTAAKQHSDQKRKEEMKRRQQEILAQFAVKQQRFLTTIATESDSTTGSDQEGIDSVLECALCREVSTDLVDQPMGRVAYISPSSLLLSAKNCNWRKRNRASEISSTIESSSSMEEDNVEPITRTRSRSDSQSQSQETNSQAVGNFYGTAIKLEPLQAGVFCTSENGRQAHVRSCGHLIHRRCFEEYCVGLLVRQARHQETFFLELDQGEFNCPNCRTLCNGFLPIVPMDTTAVPGYSTSWDVEPVTPFESEDSVTVHLFGPNPAETLPLQTAYNRQRTESTPLDLALQDFILRLVSIQQDKSFTPAEVTAEESPMFVFVETALCYAVSLTDVIGVASIMNDHGALLHSMRSCLMYWRRKDNGYWKDVERFCAQRHFNGAYLENLVSDVGSSIWRQPLLSVDLFDAFMRVVLMGSQIDSKSVQRTLLMFLYLQACQVVSKLLLVSDAVEQLEQPLSSSSSAEQCQPLLAIHDTMLRLLQSHGHTVYHRSEHALLVGVEQLCLPFLRRAVVLISCLFDVPSSMLTQLKEENYMESREEYELYCQYLQLPQNPASIFHQTPEIQSFVTDRITEYVAWITPDAVSPSLQLLQSVTPFQFVELPAQFQTLMQRFAAIKCNRCKTVPPEPALCLLCGEVVCLDTACCRTRLPTATVDEGEGTVHARTCAAAVGIFLLLKTTTVFIVEAPRGCLWESPYVDRYGEEDQYLRRGKPLFLNAKRIEELRKMYITHSVGKEILAVRVRTRRWLIRPL